MLWIYTRGPESLRLETRFDNSTGEYVLISYSEDGGQQLTERFKDGASFRSRLIALENRLESEGWDHPEAPVFLRDGWRL